MLNQSRRFCQILLLTVIVNTSFSLNLFNHDDESGDSLRDRIHSHTLVHSNESESRINPEVKTAAKAAACASIGKGVCLGVQGAKYMDKKIMESSSTIK